MKPNAVFLFFVFSSVAASSLIDKWGRCKITDPNLDECLSKACANMIVDMRQGNAEYGIPPWEPFKINKMDLRPSSNDPGALKFYLDDMTLIHITEFSELTADASQLKDMVLKFTMVVPSMNVTSKYNVTGKMLTLPVHGAGVVKLKFIKTDLDFTIKGKKLDKEGKSYWKVDDFTVSLSPTNLKMEFVGLFNGDKKLSDTAVKLFRQNWRVLIKQVMPFISSGVAETAMPIANIITQMEPFHEMFPK